MAAPKVSVTMIFCPIQFGNLFRMRGAEYRASMRTRDAQSARCRMARPAHRCRPNQREQVSRPLFFLRVRWQPLTDTLIHGIHAHVLVKLRSGILSTSGSRCTTGLLLSINVVHPFSKLRRCHISKREANDYHGAGQIIRKIEPFR